MSGPRIVIVGGVAGGASVAARARRLSEEAVITVIERSPHVSFANCGLPYFVGREITDADRLIVRTPQSLHRRLNLDVHVRHEVLAIDREARCVTVRDLDAQRTFTEPYDELVLSTGAAPLVPPIPGIDRTGHFTLRNIVDMHRIDDWIDDKAARRAVVVGGGYIGLEMAEQLKRRGLDVAVAEALPQVMAPLDEEMAAMLHAELRRQGVTLHLGDAVAGFEPPRDGESAGASVVTLKSGARLAGDVVILGLGVRPETSLAADAGLTIGERGGLRVDEHMRTSDPHIYAIGDAVEVKNPVTGQWSLVALAGPANRQGRIVADNIFGRNATYKGTLGTAALRLFGLTAACTGANERTLRQAGIDYQVIHLHPNQHAGYFPGAKPIALKLIFDPAGGRILGAQAVGADGVDKRIDVLATAMAAGMTVDDLVDLELAYAPPFSSARDPVNVAGMIAQNVMRGDVHIVQWHQLEKIDPSTTLLLDVRDDTERARGAIPGSIHIPLDDLRGRLGELPRDKTIYVHCRSGQRSYLACRILMQHGYPCANLTGAYQTWAAAHAVE